MIPVVGVRLAPLVAPSPMLGGLEWSFDALRRLARGRPDAPSREQEVAFADAVLGSLPVRRGPVVGVPVAAADAARLAREAHSEAGFAAFDAALVHVLLPNTLWSLEGVTVGHWVMAEYVYQVGEAACGVLRGVTWQPLWEVPARLWSGWATLLPGPGVPVLGAPPFAVPPTAIGWEGLLHPRRAEHSHQRIVARLAAAR